MRRRWVQLLRLSGYELWHERWIALCSACVVGELDAREFGERLDRAERSL